MTNYYRCGKLIEWDSENPPITCLMSVYNGETYLREAIDSILDQTYSNFEFLIINDGSTDNSVSILESYDDPRIRLIHNGENIGLTKSLNKGINLAKGDYIARMDADDVSIKERFEYQLKKISGFDCVCSQAIDINISLDNSKKIASYLFFENPIIHSSVFIKKNVLNVNKYDSTVRFAQDYDLWTRLIKKHKFSLVQKSVIKNNLNENRLGISSFHKQKKYADLVRYKYYESFGLILNDSEKDIISRMTSISPGYSYKYFHEVIELFNKLKKVYDDSIDENLLKLLIDRYIKLLFTHYPLIFNIKNRNFNIFVQRKEIYNVSDYFNIL